MDKPNILIIDDNKKYISSLKAGLENIMKKEEKYFDILPDKENVEDFTKQLKNLSLINKEELYKYIKKYINDYKIDLVILDFLLNDNEGNLQKIFDGKDSIISNSSGLDFINKINNEKDDLKNIPIASYTRILSTMRKSKSKSRYKNSLSKIKIDIEKHASKTEIIDYFQTDISKFYKIYFEAELYKNSKKETFDIAVICALNEEFEQIKNAFGIEAEQNKFEKDNKIYYKKNIKNKNGLEYKIVLSCIHAMGMVEAATYTSKIMSKFSPKLVIMTGIAAGTGENGKNQKFGDILIPERIYNWQFGKYHSKIDEKNNSYKEYFTPDMRQEQRNLIDQEYLNSHKDTFFNDITDEYQIVMKGAPVIKKFQKTYNIHTDKMVSGSAVVADKEIIDNFINTNDRKVDGLDMESYGVAYAANKNGVKWLVIKSISDFADDEKKDDYHNYCSFASAKMAEILIKKHIVL